MQDEKEAQHIKKLKESVEARFGKKPLYSKDCKILSEQIFDATSRQLSMSTIKRFFGLIPSPFKPSKYTLDTFAKYLELDNWEAYMNFQNEAKTSCEIRMNQVKKEAQFITNISIGNMINNAGYNKRKFIKRKFADEYLNEFIQSNHSTAILIAPRGYGKSSIILQWYYDYFRKGSEYTDDVVCMIDGGIYFAIYNEAMENELLRQLNHFDIHKNPKLFPEAGETSWNNHFFIIIDNIDRVFTDRERLYQFAENLSQFILANKFNRYLKIILTCRPENIEIFISLKMHNPSLAESLFNVNLNYDNCMQAINIPLFSPPEMKQVLEIESCKIPFFKLSICYPDMLSVINHPTYLSDFVKYSEISHSDFSEMGFLNYLIRQLFFSAPFAEEKLELVKKYLLISSAKNDKTMADKNLLLDNLSYHLAYQELHKSGIVYEQFESGDTPGKRIMVKIANQIIFEYLSTRVFTKLNETNQHGIINLLLSSGIENPYYFGIYKWYLKLAFHDADVQLIKKVHEATEQKLSQTKEDSIADIQHIPPFYKIYMQGIRTHENTANELMHWFAHSRLGRKFYFEDYFDFDNIMSFALQSLKEYEQCNSSADGKLLVYYIKYFQAYFSLNRESCISVFNDIHSIKVETLKNEISVGWYYSVVILNATLLKSPITDVVTESVVNIRKRTSEHRKNASQAAFNLYITLNGCGHYKEMIKLSHIAEIEYNSPQDTSDFYYQFNKLCYARAMLHSDDKENAIQIYNNTIIGEIPFHLQHYIHLNLHMIHFDFLIYKNEYIKASVSLNEMKKLATEMKFKYFIVRASEMETQLLNIQKR